MNNSITRAVLFTIRDIENRDYFEGVSPEPSQPLIDYFLSRGDDLTSWLNKHALKRDIFRTVNEPPIDKYKLLSEVIQKNADEFESVRGPVISEEQSLKESISNAQNLGELQVIKASFLMVYEDVPETEQSKWGTIHSFISEIPDAESSEFEGIQSSNRFSLEDYKKIASNSLDSNVTYCDKEKPLVQHRLGWYHKEDNDGTAVCAVYPWLGETDDVHNEKWTRALISTLLSEYPSIERIILVCHDRDFSGFSGKDEVVTGDFFNALNKLFMQLSSLIVFQHSNSTITGSLKMNNATEVFKAIEEYAVGYDNIKKADEANMNSKAHDKCLKDNTTEDGGEK